MSLLIDEAKFKAERHEMDMAKSRLELELLAAQIQHARAKTYGIEEWNNLIKLKKIMAKNFCLKIKIFSIWKVKPML